MTTRGDFLKTVTAGGIATISVVETSETVADAAAVPPRTSPAAQLFADGMRHFDPTLTDSELATIAEGIEQTLNTGKWLNPKGKRLNNDDGPTPEFSVV